MAEPAQPEISVVIPCYNTRPDFIAETLDSLDHQSFRDFEVIVVDDGSNDPDTLAYLAGLGERVQLIRQDNKGLPAARNTGFRAARGALVLPLDSDDFLASDFLEKARSALHATPEAAFSCAWITLEGEAEGILRKGYNLFEQLFLNQLPYCLLMQRSAWEAVGGYDETMRQGYEDWEFNIRLGVNGYLGTVVAEPLFHYRVRSDGMLIGKSSRLHGTLWKDIQKRHPQSYSLGGLWRLWRAWRTVPSTYAPLLLIGLLAAHRFLPTVTFAALFRRLLKASQSRRVTRASRRDGRGVEA